MTTPFSGGTTTTGRRRKAVVVRALVILAACAAAFVPAGSEFVERWFANGVYPLIQRTLTVATNLTPFAWLDVIAAILTTWLVRLWWRAWRSGSGVRRDARATRLAHAALDTLTAAAIVYIAFLALWGLNYRRVPLARQIVLDKPPPTTGGVVQLGMQAVERINAGYASAHLGGPPDAAWMNAALRAASGAVQRSLGRREPAAVGRMKPTLFGFLFRWNGTDGMTNPWGLEVLRNPDLLPFERPFVAAHEWAHLAGYADESEANFVGWLTCLGADEPSQYSGWLYLYWQISGELGRADRDRVAAALEEGPRADLQAIADRLSRGDVPFLRRASWAAYDQYLKANRVPAGVRSYGDVVTLILRAQFQDGWRPVRVTPG